MPFKLSKHALGKHQNEKWNAVTIRDALLGGMLENVEFLQGNTANIYCGKIEGECVGLIVSKDEENPVIITGFAAPLEYWKSV